MKVLVTGAGGLLGGRIIEYLLASRFEVIALSRSFTGVSVWNGAVEIVNVDINQTIDLHKYLEGVEVVIHAAGMNAGDSINDPVNALYFNGVITTKLLQTAINCSVKQFIYLSTAHVYSNRMIGVINEKSPAGNLHPYATSHKAGEDSVLFANQQQKIYGAVLRLTNAFGYPINDMANCWMLLVNDLCRQAASKRELRLNSPGNQYRNFISISEVCKLIKFLIEQAVIVSEYPLINVASKNVIPVISMAKLIQKRAELLFGYSIPLSYPQDTPIERTEAFDIQTSSLDNLSYYISNDLTTEVDILLEYCQEKFGR